MINKIRDSMAEAFQGLTDGASIMVGGFGGSGVPHELVDFVVDLKVKDLVIITNNSGADERGVAALFRERRVRKLICSYPRTAEGYHFEAAYKAGQVELELVAQGNLAERIRAAGAGLGGYFAQTSYGTLLAEGKETREINGKWYVFQEPLSADYALIKAKTADRFGNLTYRKAGRNFGPVMAMGGKVTIAQVSEIVDAGQIDPETVVTPGIFVKHVVQVKEAV
jgi:3-oxoadipate CoA-transferase, alpha subunit